MSYTHNIHTHVHAPLFGSISLGAGGSVDRLRAALCGKEQSRYFKVIVGGAIPTRMQWAF